MSRSLAAQQYLGVSLTGMDLYSKLFTNRQLVALIALSDLVSEASEMD